MCSIRKAAIIAAGMLWACVLGGCQFAVNRPVNANLDHSTLIVDEAMQRRDWDRSVARYANGDTIAGPDLIVIESTGPTWLQRVTDPAISSINDGMVPVTTVLDPPWKDRIYPGVQVPPTYTAQPAPQIIK